MCSVPNHGSISLAIIMGNLLTATSWVSPTTDVLHGGLPWRAKRGDSPQADFSRVKIVKHLLGNISSFWRKSYWEGPSAVTKMLLLPWAAHFFLRQLRSIGVLQLCMTNRDVALQRTRVRERCVGRGAKWSVLFAE